jgi:hypothetical protein
VEGLPPAVDFSRLAGFQNLLFFLVWGVSSIIASPHDFREA